jgi:hypothetical protein
MPPQQGHADHRLFCGVQKARGALPLISKGFLPLSANPRDMGGRN